MNSFTYAEISAAVMGVFLILQIIVRFTKTKKDDEIVSKIGKFINLIFNKTNIKNELEDKVANTIMDEAINKLAAKEKGLAEKLEKECNNITENIAKKVKSKGKNAVVEVLKNAPKTVVGKIIREKIRDRIKERIASRSPRTGFGKIMKGMFSKLER